MPFQERQQQGVVPEFTGGDSVSVDSVVMTGQEVDTERNRNALVVEVAVAATTSIGESAVISSRQDTVAKLGDDDSLGNDMDDGRTISPLFLTEERTRSESPLSASKRTFSGGTIEHPPSDPIEKTQQSNSSVHHAQSQPPVPMNIQIQPPLALISGPQSPPRLDSAPQNTPYTYHHKKSGDGGDGKSLESNLVRLVPEVVVSEIQDGEVPSMPVVVEVESGRHTEEAVGHGEERLACLPSSTFQDDSLEVSPQDQKEAVENKSKSSSNKALFCLDGSSSDWTSMGGDPLGTPGTPGNPISSTPASKQVLNWGKGLREEKSAYTAVDSLSVTSLTSLPEGVFSGLAQHKDGSLLAIVFQVDFHDLSLSLSFSLSFSLSLSLSLSLSSPSLSLSIFFPPFLFLSTFLSPYPFSLSLLPSLSLLLPSFLPPLPSFTPSPILCTIYIRS